MIKNKVVCILLAFSVVFSQAVICTQAKTIKEADDLETLIKLGFVNEDAKNDGYVTRAEFIDLAARLKNAPAAAEALSYADLSKDNPYYSSIAAAKALGIISGVDSSNVCPDDILTQDQMQTILIRTLGYVGMSQEQFDSVSKTLSVKPAYSSESLVTWKAASEAVFDAFEEETVLRQIKENKAEYVKTGKKLLEDYHDIYTYEGIVNSVGESSITGESAVGDDEAMIGSEVFVCRDMKLRDFLGSRVKIYYGDEERNILSVRQYGNNILKINADDIDSFKSGRLSYYDGSKLKSAKISVNVDVLYNDRCDRSFRGADFKIENGTVTLTDNNSDGTYEFADIREPKIGVVSGTDTKKDVVYFKYKLGSTITLKPDSITGGRGEEIDIRELMAGDVLCLYMSRDMSYINAALCTDTVDGKITDIQKDGDKTEICINGVRFKVLKSCAENQSEYIKNGLYAAFYLDPDGSVAYIADIENVLTYGYAVNINYNEDDELISLKLLTADNTFLNAVVSEKLKYNGKRIDSIVSFWQSIGMKSFRHRLVKYKINSLGVVTELCDSSSEEYFKMLYTDYSYDTGRPVKKSDNMKHYYKSDSNIIANKVHVGGNTIVMVVPDDAELTDEKYYLASDITYLKNDFEYRVEAYSSLTDDFTSEAIVIYDDVSSDYSVNDQNTGISILDSVYQGVNSDGDTVDGAAMWTNGEKFSYLFSDSEMLKKVYGEYEPSKGDIIRYSLKNDAIYKLELIYSASKDTMVAPTSVTHKNDNNRYTQFRVWDAYVFYRWGSNLMLSDKMPTDYQNFNYGDYEIHSCASSSITVVDLTNKDIYPADSDSLIGYKNTFGAECSRVIMYERYGGGISIVIYK